MSGKARGQVAVGRRSGARYPALLLADRCRERPEG